jgi:hypothetical protein
MERRIADRHAPLLGQGGGRFIKGRSGNRKSQLVFQCQAQLLMARQSIPFPHDTTPMLIGRILAVDRLKLNRSGDGAK